MILVATSFIFITIEPLPNGNILVISIDVHTPAEAIAEGRDPSTVNDEFWGESIIEIEPVGIDSINIVWEWHSWDHLIQDYSSGANNYGVVADHPELLNINYSISGGVNANVDWLHFNSVDYNPDLDQIILSSRNSSEVLIIDHSTTTAEAAGHSGGIYGKGGDILYRFGNPDAYDRGGPDDRLLFFQHDAQWIPEGTRDEKKIIVFNNKAEATVSAVNLFNPPMDSAGYYTNPGENPFGPEQFDWSYSSPDIFSPTISGVQRLPNGNTLICRGKGGLFTEIDIDGNILWSYINPDGADGPVSQGDIIDGNNVFKVRRYGPGYNGFAGQELVPGDPVELNPWASDCTIIEDTIADLSFKVYLEGPFNNGEMTTNLNESDLLPLSHPFVEPPWNYSGTESVSEIPNIDIVDWVMVDLRDAVIEQDADPSTRMSRQAAFLLKDGSIVDLDGTTPLKFYNSIENSMFVTIWHRNHLGVISSSPVSEVFNYLDYDFTTGENKVLGGINGHKEIGNNIWGLYSGDGNADGIIDELDKDTIWSSNVGLKGLFQADYNLEGYLDNKDKNDRWYLNLGKSSQVPE